MLVPTRRIKMHLRYRVALSVLLPLFTALKPLQSFVALGFMSHHKGSFSAHLCVNHVFIGSLYNVLYHAH